MGYAKLVISFVKYTPAVYWNWKRKSTKGWSIFNIILDLVGGIFSFASGTLSIADGLNFAKLMLAILSIGFDIVFIVQHYFLYNKKKPVDSEKV